MALYNNSFGKIATSWTFYIVVKKSTTSPLSPLCIPMLAYKLEVTITPDPSKIYNLMCKLLDLLESIFDSW